MAWKNVQYENGKYRTSSGGGGGASEFADLDDVNFTDLQNGQIPKYNSTTQKWENADDTGGGGSVTDVEVDGVSVVNQQGVAEITMPTIPVEDVEVNGASVVNQQGVAEITSYKEVTQAEYDALPASKLADGVLYCIKDAHGADGYPPLIYSDEEREVGVWRDGKPLYQKTVTGIFTNNATTLVVNIAANMDIVVDLRGFLIPSDTPTNKISLETQNNLAWISDMNSASGNCTITRGNGGYFGDSPTVWVTVCYTKTTDTAGSGTWTTQGAYAHHYSTSEKVVGTWTDGKPLYEKTIDANCADTSNVQNVYAFNNERVKAITSAYFENNNGDIIASTWAGLIFWDFVVTNTVISVKRNTNDPNWQSNVNFNCTIQYTKTTD